MSDQRGNTRVVEEGGRGVKIEFEKKNFPKIIIQINIYLFRASFPEADPTSTGEESTVLVALNLILA